MMQYKENIQKAIEEGVFFTISLWFLSIICKYYKGKLKEI